MVEVEKIMKSLNVTKEEALEIIAYDKEVDKMSVREAESDLSQEQKAILKKMRSTGTKEKKAPTIYKLDNEKGKRSKKKNETKADLIKALAEFLKQYECLDVTITNAERQITFGKDGNNYDLTLIQKRQKK